MNFLPSIDHGRLLYLQLGDEVSFRHINGQHVSGILSEVLPDHVGFRFQHRGFVLNACEIADICDHARPAARNANRIVVVMEGGVIQNVMADADIDVLVLDYDTEGAEDEELVSFGRHDALLFKTNIETGSADLDEVWTLAKQHNVLS